MKYHKKKIKIAFSHPELRDYREPFFDGILKTFDVRFLFHKIPYSEKYPYSYIGTERRNIWLDKRAMANILKELLVVDYDVLFSSHTTSLITVIGSTIAKLRKKKIVIWEEAWFFNGNGVKPTVRRFLKRVISSTANALFLTGSRAVETHKRLTRVNSSKIFSTVQCSLDQRLYFKKRMKIPEAKGRTVFLFMGRMIDWKGLDILIQAYSYVEKECEDTFLLLAGDGELRNAYEELATRLGLKRYFFYGWVSDINEKAAIFDFCDIFILPSRILGRKYEAWGLVVNEAMSMGKPVLVSDAVGCAFDLVKDGVNGYIFRHSCPDSLSRAMRKILSSKEKLDEMGKMSRKLYEKKNDYQQMIKTFGHAVKYSMGNIKGKNEQIGITI